MAVTGDYQFDLDGFTFGTGTNTSLVSISGLDMPEIDATSNTAGNRHGSSTAGRYYKERTIGMVGRINGTYSTFPALRDSIVRAFRPRPTDDDVRFTIRLPGRANQYINVKPQNLRGDFTNISTAVGFWDFNATLLAGDPRIYTELQSSATLTVGAPASTLNNSGNSEAEVTISFNGALTDPRITNSTTGQSFALTATIAAGQSYVASSLDSSVYLGTTSKYATISTLYRTFIQLAPGNNSLTLTGAGTGNAVITWRGTSF